MLCFFVCETKDFRPDASSVNSTASTTLPRQGPSGPAGFPTFEDLSRMQKEAEKQKADAAKPSSYPAPHGTRETLLRVCQLIRLGPPARQFRESATGALRVLESELRDELARVGISDAPYLLVTSNTPPPETATPAGVPDPQTAPPGDVSAGTSQQPKAPVQSPPERTPAPPVEPPPCVAQSTPKSAPEKPPTPAETRTPVKEEVASPAVEEVDKKKEQVSPVLPSPAASKGEERTPKQSRRKRRKSESKKQSESRSRSPEKKRRRKKRRSSSSEVVRREKEDSPKSSGGKERKNRGSERPPEPEGPPPALPRRQFPQPSSASQQGLHRLPPRPGPGSSWRGPIPFSSHPRWNQGQNKGVTKRAKQELHSQRKRRNY
eukprot:Skav210271  [mRNA]  locus=scaffold2977:12816:15243:+ [translate_table: standard]